MAGTPAGRSAAACWSDSPIGVSPSGCSRSMVPSRSSRSSGATGTTSSVSWQAAALSALATRCPYTLIPTSRESGSAVTISRRAALALAMRVEPAPSGSFMEPE